MSATPRAESSASTPEMNSMKNGSSARIRDGRAITRPHASAREAESARAARLGYQPRSAAIPRMRSRVASETPGCPFSAYETAPFETPARSAMSAIVTLRAGPVFLATLRPPAAASGADHIARRAKLLNRSTN